MGVLCVVAALLCGVEGIGFRGIQLTDPTGGGAGGAGAVSGIVADRGGRIWFSYVAGAAGTVMASCPNDFTSVAQCAVSGALPDRSISGMIAIDSGIALEMSPDVGAVVCRYDGGSNAVTCTDMGTGSTTISASGFGTMGWFQSADGTSGVLGFAYATSTDTRVGTCTIGATELTCSVTAHLAADLPMQMLEGQKWTPLDMGDGTVTFGITIDPTSSSTKLRIFRAAFDGSGATVTAGTTLPVLNTPNPNLYSISSTQILAYASGMVAHTCDLSGVCTAIESRVLESIPVSHPVFDANAGAIQNVAPASNANPFTLAIQTCDVVPAPSGSFVCGGSTNTSAMDVATPNFVPSSQQWGSSIGRTSAIASDYGKVFAYTLGPTYPEMYVFDLCTDAFLTSLTPNGKAMPYGNCGSIQIAPSTPIDIGNTLTIDASSVVTINGTVTVSATLAVSSGGQLRVSSITLAPTSSVEVSYTAAASTTAIIAVDGVATLAGAFVLNVPASSTFAPGQTVLIITFSSSTGAFESATISYLTSRSSGTRTRSTQAASLSITCTTTSCTGTGVAPSSLPSSSPSSTGVIVGIAVGAIVFLGLVLVLVFFVVSRSRSRSASASKIDQDMTDVSSDSSSGHYSSYDP